MESKSRFLKWGAADLENPEYWKSIAKDQYKTISDQKQAIESLSQTIQRLRYAVVFLSLCFFVAYFLK